MSNTITYHGDDVNTTLANHSDVVRVVEKLSSELTGATIRVHVMSPATDNEPLEWIFSFTSTAGRRTLDLKQRKPCGTISITDAFK
jgi:hypothetical protein